MTTSQLEQVIREYIEEFYGMEYIGKIGIKKLNPGYHIRMGMNVPEKPWIICGMLEDDEFIPFLKQTLRESNFQLRHYGELRKLHPCIPQNQPCCKKS